MNRVDKPSNSKQTNLYPSDAKSASAPNSRLSVEVWEWDKAGYCLSLYLIRWLFLCIVKHSCQIAFNTFHIKGIKNCISHVIGYLLNVQAILHKYTILDLVI